MSLTIMTLYIRLYQIDVYSNAANIKWVFDWRSQASCGS